MKLTQRHLMKVERLKFASHNPANRTKPDAVRVLADSMDKIGLIHPVTVTGDLRIIDGHRRVAAAKTLGWKEIECTVVEGDPDEIYASINVTPRKMSGNDALGVWLANPKAVTSTQGQEFRRMQDVIGRGLMTRIYDQGLSKRVYQTARRIARYCDNDTPETAQAIVGWLLEFAVIGQVMKAMEAGESPRLILDAVRRKKPIRMKLAVVD